MSTKDCIICYNKIIKNKNDSVNNDVYGNCDCSDVFVKETCTKCIETWIDLNQRCIFCRKHMFIYKKTLADKFMMYIYLMEVVFFLYIIFLS